MIRMSVKVVVTILIVVVGILFVGGVIVGTQGYPPPHTIDHFPAGSIQVYDLPNYCLFATTDDHRKVVSLAVAHRDRDEGCGR